MISGVFTPVHTILYELVSNIPRERHIIAYKEKCVVMLLFYPLSIASIIVSIFPKKNIVPEISIQSPMGGYMGGCLFHWIRYIMFYFKCARCLNFDLLSDLFACYVREFFKGRCVFMCVCVGVNNHYIDFIYLSKNKPWRLEEGGGRG